MEKESRLNLRLTAQNEANPAFTALTESMASIQRAMSEATQSIQRDLESITKAASGGTSSVSTSMREDETAIRGLATVAGESSTDVEKALHSIETAISSVTMAVRTQTGEIKSAMSSMSTGSSESASKMTSAIGKGGLLIGLQQVGQSMEHLGETGKDLFTDAIKSAAEFEKSMSNVHAVLMHREPEANMKAMQEAALKLGSDSKFSANEIATGMYDLARQGLSSTQILGDGVNGAINVVNNLAQSVDGDMGETAKVIADVMHEFGLSGDQLSHVGDMISGAMHTSSITMNDFYYSMRQIGPVASNMHQSIDDTSTAIALLAQHGISGSSAGTALKNMLLGLEPRTEKAAALMKDLGISAKDGAAESFYQLNGDLKPLPDIIGILNDKFGGLNDKQKEAALAATFTKYGLAGLNTVVMEGRDKFEELKKTLSEEKSADIAKEKLNNLQGDMLRLNAATETMKKSFGDTLAPAMRSVTQEAQSIVNGFAALDPETKKTIMVIGGVVSAMAVVGGAILTAISTIGFLSMGLEGLGLTFGALMGPVGIAIAAIGLLVVAGYEVYTHWDQIKAFFTETWDKIKNYAVSVFNGILDFFKEWGPWMLAALGGPIGIIVKLVYDHWDEIKTFTATLWNDIVSGIKNLWNGFTTWISDAVQKTMQAVVDSFQWLYDHNYYFHDLVDAIKNEWDIIKQDAEDIWNGLTQFFSTVWEGIKTAADTFWESLKLDFETTWNAIITSADNVWTPIETFFSNVWTTISTDAESAWNTISTSLSTLWNAVVTDAETIFNKIGDYFTGLWDEAFKWGTNLVHMLGNGIKSAANEVADAAKDIAGSIAKFLGFHSPTEDGPASDSDTWAPNFVSMFANGLNAGIPKISAASAALVQPIADTFTGLTGKNADQVAQITNLAQWVINAKKDFETAAVKHDEGAMISAHNLADQYRENLEAMGFDTQRFSADTSLSDAMVSLESLTKQTTSSMYTHHSTMTSGMTSNLHTISSNTALHTGLMAGSWQTSTEDVSQSNDVMSANWNNVTTSIADTTVRFSDKIKSVFDDISNAIKVAAFAIHDVMITAFNSVADQAITSMQRVVAAVNDARAAVASVNSSGGGYTSYSGNDSVYGMTDAMPAFADGAKVTKPTVALIGEGGEAEYVIPESKLRAQDGYTLGAGLPQAYAFGGGKSGNNVVVNVGGITINGTGKDGQQIGMDVLTLLRNQMSFAF